MARATVMSISKSQSRLLADKFLDDLGSSKEELQPRETYSELIQIAGDMVDHMQRNLEPNTSSGALSESIVMDEPTRSGDILRIDVMMNFYGRFLNKGVRGTKSGKGLYKFKTEFPSLKMVEALKASISRAGKKITNANRNRTVSQNELKNASVSDVQRAFAAGRNIKMYGIKPTGFLDKAIIKTQQGVAERLGAALKVDVVDWLGTK